MPFVTSGKTPTDSLGRSKLSYTTLLLMEAGGHLTAFTGLYFLWYKNYPQTKFHFFNDLPEWLQMDKAGHFYSGYWLTRLQTYVWKQTNHRNPALMGALWSAVAMTGIEILDGFSAKWGASVYDAIANFAGISLALWQETNPSITIFPSFSFHPVKYPDEYSERARQLFGTFPISLLKDYNGQTYWLAIGHKNWVILPAIGYSAEGMLGGTSNCWTENGTQICANIPRQRQFLLSFTINWKRLNVNWKYWKTLASVLNIIKVPGPALMLTLPEQRVEFYFAYF
ncbi:MAG: DUF2279 domain-containing protein [Chlorobi bacterium]|nr:DUF2279 domain-containing protein [Chlorobiota bacterium]